MDLHIQQVMSSLGIALPSAARGILSSCRSSLRETSVNPSFPVLQQIRGLKSNPQAKGKGKKAAKPSRRGPQEFRQKNLKDMDQFALCDAMRYVQI